MKKRIAVIVYLDLDPVPGPFHTDESAKNNIQGILETYIDHYNPMVSHAPDDIQPYLHNVTVLPSDNEVGALTDR